MGGWRGSWARFALDGPSTASDAVVPSRRLRLRCPDALVAWRASPGPAEELDVELRVRRPGLGPLNPCRTSLLATRRHLLFLPRPLSCSRGSTSAANGASCQHSARDPDKETWARSGVVDRPRSACLARLAGVPLSAPSGHRGKQRWPCRTPPEDGGRGLRLLPTPCARLSLISRPLLHRPSPSRSDGLTLASHQVDAASRAPTQKAASRQTGRPQRAMARPCHNYL